MYCLYLFRRGPDSSVRGCITLDTSGSCATPGTWRRRAGKYRFILPHIFLLFFPHIFIHLDNIFPHLQARTPPHRRLGHRGRGLRTRPRAQQGPHPRHLLAEVPS